MYTESIRRLTFPPSQDLHLPHPNIYNSLELTEEYLWIDSMPPHTKSKPVTDDARDLSTYRTRPPVDADQRASSILHPSASPNSYTNGRCRLDRTDVTALYLDPRGMVHCLQRAPNAKNFSCRWWPEEIETRKDGLGLILYNGCSQQFAAREQVGLEWLCFYWSWSKRVRLQVESFHIRNIKHRLIIKLIIKNHL